MANSKIFGRHGSRFVALQALYAWTLTGESLSRIEADLLAKEFQKIDENQKPQKISFDRDYLHELIHQIPANLQDLDEFMSPYLDRPLEEISPIEHAILRIAIYELKFHPETPYKVVINEAILLAKSFGGQDSHKFVNGVLDKAMKVIRSNELAQAL